MLADSRLNRATQRLRGKRRFRFALSRLSLSTSVRKHGMLATLVAVLLAGCSLHPLPDDVSPIPTEEIVRSARCELRLGLFEEIEHVLNSRGITNWTARDIGQNFGAFVIWLKDHVKKNPKNADLVAKLNLYGNVAVAYDFDFKITEDNNSDASLGFKVPYTLTSSLALNASGSLHKQRFGDRAFKAQETFADMVSRNIWCVGFKPRERNILYPITGSIGLQKVVETFVSISEQGGGKDSFVDTITFTTTISGSVNPILTLAPVPRSFRLVNASGTFESDRTDIHKVVISLAFPQDKAQTPAAQRKLRASQSSDLSIVPPVDQTYGMNTAWRARYNICVADARNREDTFNMLRLSPPEVYCITYADAFVPRYLDPGLQRQLVAPR
jgi:hypothetical protein